MISVIMSVYDEEKKWLKDAIESILNQTYKDFEFVITLDKPDNELLESVIKSYVDTDNRIVFVKNEQNMGLVWSLNNMLKIAKGDYIARMDADDFAFPNRFEKQMSIIKEQKADFVGSSVIVFSENGEYLDEAYEKDAEIKESIYTGGHITHPTWLIKRKVYEELNGYRNIYSAEDFDFILRAMRHGFVFHNCMKPLVKYRINTNGISRKNALKQKMTSMYLIDNISKIDEITQDDINKRLKKVNQGREERYSKGERTYLKIKETKKKTTKIKLLFELVFKYYIYLKYNKIRNTKIRIKRRFVKR